MKLPVIDEYHSGDLTERCMAKAMFRRKGQVKAEYPKAMYRGQLGGRVLQYFHEHIDCDQWANEDLIDDVVEVEDEALNNEAHHERRPPTKAVNIGKEALLDEVDKHCSHYLRRLAPRFDECDLVGTELPCRLTIEHPEWGTTKFASHLDLVFREHGQLHIWDFKWRKERPTYQYLCRDLQMGLYYLMATEGSIQTDASLDLWVDMKEFPRMGMVDLTNFKPYAKATTRDGTSYKKGDDRPLDSLILEWENEPSRADAIKSALLQRVVMMQHGIYPTSPDPVGCMLCESSDWCPSFTRAQDRE